MTPVISAEKLSVSYGDHQVLENLSLAVEEGGFIGILGPNGCGKTTFLRTLSRILEPDAGAVMVEGLDVSTYDTKALAKILGCVRQETDVAFGFTVREIVLMGRHPHIGRLAPLSETDLAIADEAMRTTNTLHLADRLVTEVSGGERQRVLIARTLAQQPRILLLDEPTSHLDINHQLEILQLIHSLTPKITVVGVFHDFNLASYFCDRLILMNGGKITAAGTPAEVLTANRIRESFQVQMLVSLHPLTGKPYCVPEYETASETAAENGVRVHVISGGGSGAKLFHALASRGCRITAGVVAINDADFSAAAALDVEIITEPPFAAVSYASAQRLREIIHGSDAVVVCGMPIGQGNLANLLVLQDADVPIYFLGECEDFTGGEASALVEELCGNGAVQVSDTCDLIRRLGL
ncbi:ABC transporter ATP-binding protein [Methanorbis furvi]|uniref:Cobalamin import ATP-binding protein BtuD n=1 Tax=Methanorbis furvi TaxID=3028299 RepID=A0AAE4SBA6_9EURY|nr:Vitamin B12 import ATP-binding protein BtuD [Methanocorpusculaceae archaeon Ag1]